MAKNNRFSQSMTNTETWLGWGYLALSLFVLPTLLVMANAALNYPLGSSWINFIYFSINFLAVLVIFHRFLGRNLSDLGSNLFRTLKAAFLGFCVYYVSTMAVNNLISFLYPSFSNVNDANVSSLIRLDVIPMVIGTMILVPVAEEILYRGVVFHSLYSRNHALGYVLSTLVFCAIHVMGYIGTHDPVTLTLCFIQYIPASLCLAWAYTEADNIFAPILIHMVVNTMGIYAVR